MFGFKTVVVGNLPNTKLAAAVAAANEQDGNKFDHTEIIRVNEKAWLGDWIAEVLPIKEAEESDSDVTFEQLTADFPDLGGDYEGGDIPGAPRPEDFYLSVGHVCEEGNLDRQRCAYVASQSLVKEDEDTFEMVYGVIMTEATFAKQNARLMLDELASWQNVIHDGNLHFKIRVFVVKDDGSVEMNKL